MSSADLVNWADHGSIAVARPTKGAKNSWASTATTKRLKINGQEKFFFFLANSGNGIGILSTDSPTGPFKNPFHRSLINFVFVDDDGTYLIYFSSVVPNGQNANPKIARIAKLSGDITGTNCFYITSNNPMDSFLFQGTCINNPSDFFQAVGNNHYTIIEIKNKYYIFYHDEWLNKQIGNANSTRITHIDELPVSNVKLNNTKDTLIGVTQVTNVNGSVDNLASSMA
ncbi:glycosyl hydrolase [Neocallimastix sp. 'constans']